MLSATMQIDHRGGEAGMAQQSADRQQIDSRFEQPRRVGVPKRVRRDVLVDVRQQGRGFDRFLNRRVGVGFVR